MIAYGYTHDTTGLRLTAINHPSGIHFQLERRIPIVHNRLNFSIINP